MRYIAGVVYGAIGVFGLVSGQPGPGVLAIAYAAYLMIGRGRKWIIY